MRQVLILGSSPALPAVKTWSFASFEAVVVINNAWQIRDDWTHHIHPEDFPQERRPSEITPAQTRVTYKDYVPAQNRFGGFVYGGGTMAFTAAYWALEALKPDRICFFACDMVYPSSGPTHFYGTGAADPLREDPTLRSLKAKAHRFEICAAGAGTAVVNLSQSETVLPYARARHDSLDHDRLDTLAKPRQFHPDKIEQAFALEQQAGYFVESGRYWETQDQFDLTRLDRIDAAWCAAGLATVETV